MSRKEGAISKIYKTLRMLGFGSAKILKFMNDMDPPLCSQLSYLLYSWTFWTYEMQPPPPPPYQLELVCVDVPPGEGGVQNGDGDVERLLAQAHVVLHLHKVVLYCVKPYKRQTS